MNQEIVYRVHIHFPETKKISFLRSVEGFLRLLAEVDYLLAHMAGIEIIHKSSLKEMSESGFHYDVRLRIIWPEQDFLGGVPDGENLEQWLEQSREYILDGIKEKNPSPDKIARQWNAGAAAAGLTDNLVYHPMGVERLSPLVEDLTVAIGDLGTSTSVSFTGRQPNSPSS